MTLENNNTILLRIIILQTNLLPPLLQQQQQQQQRFSLDLLEFVDKCHDSHGADLWLLISSYQVGSL